MRSAWKAYPYAAAAAGVTPAAGRAWAAAGWAGAVVYRGDRWGHQRGRDYLVGRPTGLFVATRPAGRPVRDKFARRPRR